jgi:hypothetical protein
MIAIAKSSRDAGKGGRWACSVAMKMAQSTKWREVYPVNRMYQEADAVVLQWCKIFFLYTLRAHMRCMTRKKQLTVTYSLQRERVHRQAAWQKRVTA